MSPKKLGTLVLASSLALMMATGCKKKVAVAAPAAAPPPSTTTPPPPPAPRASVVSFTAEPSTIDRGQTATLRWNTTGATDVTIEPGVGTVPANGTRQVSPQSTTTYVLTAVGQGGRATDSVTLAVNVPPPPPPTTPTAAKPPLGIRLQSEVQDVFFDYDQYAIREDSRATLTRNADALKSILQDYPGEAIVLEGHADERGSAEYNLGLSDRRAKAAHEFLIQLGVPGDRVRTVSFGKEKPQCTEDTDSCHQSNRRAHFTTGGGS